MLLVFAITLAACQAGPLKNLLQPLLQQTSSLGLIHETLGIAPWWCVAALVVMCAGLLWRARRQATSSPSPASDAAEAVEAGRYPLGIAALIGLLGVLAWWLSWQSGRNYGYGVAVPTANVLQYLVTGQSRYLNWGSLFVLGILPGAFFSAWLRGQFRWRVPPVEQVPQCILGGVLMGVYHHQHPGGYRLLLVARLAGHADDPAGLLAGAAPAAHAVLCLSILFIPLRLSAPSS